MHVSVAFGKTPSGQCIPSAEDVTDFSQVDFSHQMGDVGHTTIAEIIVESIAAEGKGTPAVVSNAWYCVRCRFIHYHFQMG